MTQTYITTKSHSPNIDIDQIKVLTLSLPSLSLYKHSHSSSRAADDDDQLHVSPVAVLRAVRKAALPASAAPLTVTSVCPRRGRRTCPSSQR